MGSAVSFKPLRPRQLGSRLLRFEVAPFQLRHQTSTRLLDPKASRTLCLRLASHAHAVYKQLAYSVAVSLPVSTRLSRPPCVCFGCLALLASLTMSTGDSSEWPRGWRRNERQARSRMDCVALLSPAALFVCRP